MHILPTVISPQPIPLIAQINIVAVLSISVVFFLILLILGIRKSYKLKAENERLMKLSDDLLKESEEEKDYSDGHMYENK